MYALLLRFRIKRIGINANFEKAFLQVGLQEQDQNVTRFLWIKDTKTKEINNNLETYRFIRILFGIISTSKITIQHHLGECNSVIALQIKIDIYVDNRLRRRCNKALHRIKTNFSECVNQFTRMDI